MSKRMKKKLTESKIQENEMLHTVKIGMRWHFLIRNMIVDFVIYSGMNFLEKAHFQN